MVLNPRSFLYSVDPATAVATITLNRPERLNAWVPKMSEEMAHAIEHANNDDYMAIREVVSRRYREAGFGHRVCQIYCDSRTWDTSAYPRDFFDSVLIDGGHSADVVLSDTRKAFEVTRPGALIMWHDFCPDPTVLGAFAFISIGIALGMALPSARSAQGLGMLLFFPFFLLGGAGPPPDAMGDPMSSIANVVPLTHVVRSIQEPWLDLGSPTGLRWAGGPRAPAERSPHTSQYAACNSHGGCSVYVGK